MVAVIPLSQQFVTLCMFFKYQVWSLHIAVLFMIDNLIIKDIGTYVIWQPVSHLTQTILYEGRQHSLSTVPVYCKSLPTHFSSLYCS
jgi:hypothetical protein